MFFLLDWILHWVTVEKYFEELIGYDGNLLFLFKKYAPSRMKQTNWKP